jgi:hypothetical protein
MLDSFAWSRRKEDWRRPTAAHSSGGRGGLPSGEGRRRVGRWVAACVGVLDRQPTKGST